MAAPTDYRQVLDLRNGSLTTRSGGSDSALQIQLDSPRLLATKDGRPAQEPYSRHDATTDELRVADAAWKDFWKTDLEVDGPVKDQAFIHSLLFYLRTSIDPKGDISVSPFGLSDTTYNGHIFWDADIWVFPSLALIDPERAARIPLYRLKRLGQAEKNFQEWCAAGRPTASSPMGPLAGAKGVKFPWESSVSGKDVTPGSSKFEDHITGSVAFSVDQAAALGLVSMDQRDQLLKGAGAFYQARSTPGPQGRVIEGVVSPDENKIGAKNDLYTNLLAQFCANGGDFEGPERFALPKDGESFLTYDGDRLKGYKQTAALLAVYPLQYPPAEAQARQMMERFSTKTIANGPAMSDSVHALIWARLGEADKAYALWERGWQDFTNHPFLLFSEKRNKPATYFVTGAAGELQTVLYGFLGFRIDSRQDPKAAYNWPLKSGKWLSVKPNLPSEWKSVKLRNFAVLGKRYTLVATRDRVQVFPGDH